MGHSPTAKVACRYGEMSRSIMEVLTVFELLGQQRAIRSAENFRALRKKGAIVRSTVYVVIATYRPANSIAAPGP